jgi:hypothetical protein
MNAMEKTNTTTPQPNNPQQKDETPELVGGFSFVGGKGGNTPTSLSRLNRLVSDYIALINFRPFLF